MYIIFRNSTGKLLSYYIPVLLIEKSGNSGSAVRRNLSLVGEMIQMKCVGSEPPYPTLRSWDDDKFTDAVYKMAAGKISTWKYLNSKSFNCGM